MEIKMFLVAIDDIEFMIKGDSENVTNLIVKSLYNDLTVLDQNRNFIFSTFGSFLNKIEPKYREIIIEELIQKQIGEKEIGPVAFELTSEYKKISKEEFAEYILSNYKLDLLGE